MQSRKHLKFQLLTAFLWQACECSATKTREQNIRGTRCLSGMVIFRKLLGSKNDKTSYFKSDSQINKAYMEVM